MWNSRGLKAKQQCLFSDVWIQTCFVDKPILHGCWKQKTTAKHLICPLWQRWCVFNMQIKFNKHKTQTSYTYLTLISWMSGTNLRIRGLLSALLLQTGFLASAPWGVSGPGLTARERGVGGLRHQSRSSNLMFVNLFLRPVVLTSPICQSRAQVQTRENMLLL